MDPVIISQLDFFSLMIGAISPARMHPLTSSFTKFFFDADWVSSDLTAKPSIAELEKLGTCISLIKSSARTPYACSALTRMIGKVWRESERISMASL